MFVVVRATVPTLCWGKPGTTQSHACSLYCSYTVVACDFTVSFSHAATMPSLVRCLWKRTELWKEALPLYVEMENKGSEGRSITKKPRWFSFISLSLLNIPYESQHIGARGYRYRFPKGQLKWQTGLPSHWLLDRYKTIAFNSKSKQAESSATHLETLALSISVQSVELWVLKSPLSYRE